jgi:4'-phosphopantetheinyl transferase
MSTAHDDPPQDCLHLWYALSSDLREADRPRALELLSAQERERHDRFRFAPLRHDFLASHAFLRMVLADYVKCDPRDISFVCDEGGKPSLAPGVCDPISFNLSHTHGLAAVAVSPEGRNVGVDVEDTTRTIDVAAMRMYLTNRERAALDAEPAARREAKLYSLWTLKEAYSKALGLGLKLPLTSVEFEVADNSWGPITFYQPPGDARHWRFMQRHLEGARYCLATAVESIDGAPAQARIRKTTPLSLEECP